jgi:hypothetical protein
VSNEVSIMTNARQTLSSTLASLCAYLGSQPQSEQKTSYELELDRLLNACEAEAPGVRRYVGLLKRRAWWV